MRTELREEIEARSKRFAIVSGKENDFSYADMDKRVKENKLSRINGLQFVRSISIPCNVEVIEAECFYGCKSLSRVSFEDNR